IGAGFTGAVLAERFASRGKKILVVERRRVVAGNCYDEVDANGILIHKFGPHLFHTDDENVWKYLSRFTEWQIYFHRVKAVVDGKPVPIPFNLNTLREVFPKNLADKLEAALLKNFEYGKKIPILELKKSADADLQFLADFVYEKIFLHYTEKQWGLTPEKIFGAVTARVPIFVGRDDRYFNDRFQAVPARGYTRLVENILDHKNIKLLLNTDCKEVMALRGEEIFLFGQKFGGRLIYTGQLDELFDKKFGALPYRSLAMKFETIDAEKFQSAPSVNYPNNYNFTRITEFKLIHPAHTPRTTILKEFPQEYVAGENEPYYPIFTDEARAAYEKYSDELAKFKNITAVGRLAEYRYYDMDDAVKRALEIFDELSGGIR
ncbi:MAG: UDP-galactopyranose mutase, partial [Selenomonadaceae bacterium]|nr:UDP-galactopyranose mutase [Selenomonadaceae bacterium]